MRTRALGRDVTLNRTAGATGARLAPRRLEGRRSPRRGSIRSGRLEAGEQFARVTLEVGLGCRRDRLAGDEPLAERIHVRAVLHDAVVEVRPSREPGGADVADDLLLPHPRAGPEPV